MWDGFDDIWYEESGLMLLYFSGSFLLIFYFKIGHVIHMYYGIYNYT